MDLEETVWVGRADNASIICACVAHHRDHGEGVPGCFFSPEAEATYDRSVEALARDRGLL